MMFDFEIETIAAKFGLDPDLIRAIIKVESNFRPGIKVTETKKGKFFGFSYGLMQILDRTARALKVKNLNNLFDPYFNIQTGSTLLRDLFKVWGKPDNVVAAYNAGRPLIVKSTGKFVNQGYVNKVGKWYKFFRKKSLMGFGIMAALSYVFFKFVLKPRMEK